MPKVSPTDEVTTGRTGRVRRVTASISEINVVPYIDVMLVLLVIFMITAPLINPGQIELPQFQGLQILVVYNQGDSIRSSLSELRKAGMIGAVLSFFMLLLFLRHLPTTIIVGLTVPVSLMVTLAAGQAASVSYTVTCQ